MSTSRREFLKRMTLASAGLMAGCLKAEEMPARKAAVKPNIIYILADDLGYGDLGCYGQKQIKTPALDKMAAEGMRFTQHYAGSTVCAPSRCCLMTGLHTGHSKIRSNKGLNLSAGDLTIAEMLKKGGYTTGLIGKWGLGQEGSDGIPTQKGFDYFYGFLNQTHAHNHYPDYLWQNEEKLPLPNVVELAKGGPGGVATEKKAYALDLFMDEAVQFIHMNAAAPFFLYLSVAVPHANNEAGKEGMEVPDYGIYKNRNWPAAVKGHAAMISRMDAGIERILLLLKKLKIDQQTVVMFSSDNGPHKEGGFDPSFNKSSGELRGIKRDLYEGGIRVPLIAYWPGMIKAGSVSDHVCAFWDVMPTLAELAGLECSKQVDGISFAPTLLGQSSKQPQHDYLYWEFYEGGGKRAVRRGQWKAVELKMLSAEPTLELYDLQNDIGEKRDVSSQYPQLAAMLRQIMDRAHLPGAENTMPNGKRNVNAGQKTNEASNSN